MFRFLRFITFGLLLACAIAPAQAKALLGGGRSHRQDLPQETGFLNRTLELHGVIYHYQVYLPEEWRRDDHKQWPVILFLHGRGERGSEGMWQTQFGLPQQVRDHPERWPFVIVMPQCPLANYWTDPEMLTLAMESLDRETAEFHLDTDRTYLTGLSLGGYGAWELAKHHPQRWAAVAIAAGGIFWSYAPERWQESSTLPAEYARALGHTPVWIFHGAEDNVVVPRQSEMMYEAFKAAGGRVRLWLYQGLKHDCWTRAYNEPELPRWLLAHHLEPHPPSQPFSERLFIPLHPPAIKLASSVLESLAGEYRDLGGHVVATLFRQGDQLYERNMQSGDIYELAAETPSIFFYPNGASGSRLTFERDAFGRVIGAIYRDDRHEERWERRISASSR
jgi:predicted esterase